MITLYYSSILRRFIIVFFTILLINIGKVYSRPENDSLKLEETEIDPDKVIENSMGVDSVSLRINDTTAASFSGLDPYYCQDNVTVIPVTFTPPSPAPAKRVFVRIDNTNGITSTGQQYNANFTPSVKGKFKINYIVQDSIFYDSLITQYQPVVYQPKGGGPEVTNGCGCYVVVGHKQVYQSMDVEKVGYSSDYVVVSIGDFYLPSAICVSDAPLDLSTMVDPLFSTGLTGTQFSIVSATGTYNPAVLTGTIFDPSTVTSTTTFTIEYDYVSPLGCSDAVTRDITVSTVPATPSFTAISLGKTSPCEFTAVNYKVNSVTDATSYGWVLPSGWTGSSTTNLISTHTSSSSGNIIARALNACGASADATLAVTPNAIPDIPASITGAVAPCQTTVNGYSIAAVPGATSYVWSMPADWSGTSTTNALSATVGKATGSISVSAVNACGSSSAATFAVSTDSIPATPGAISGLNSLTQSTTNNPYDISSIGNATSYNWSYTGSGSTINGSGASVTVDFSSTATSGILNVSATNSCGTSSSSSYSILVSPSTVAQPGSFTTSTLAVCRGQSGLVYTIPNDPSVTYQWAYSGTGATINGSTNSITIDFSSSASAGQLSVTAISGVTSSTPRTISLDVRSTPATPDIISGSVIPYVGLTSIYSITSVTEATSYTWTLPASWSGSSTTNTISTTPGSTAGSVTVSASNFCGTSSVYILTGVTPGVKPATPGVISGLAVVNQGSSDHIYSISPVAGATSYVWSYSGIGATLNGTGPSITIDFSSVADSNGVLRVSAVNAYGSSNTSSMNIEVTVVSAVKKEILLEEKLSLLAFPNPYVDAAVVKVNAPTNTSITLVVTDLLGHTKNIVTDFKMQGYKEFDLPDLESGVYVLSLHAKGAVYMTKIIRIK